jgi:hypothetical protein
MYIWVSHIPSDVQPRQQTQQDQTSLTLTVPGNNIKKNKREEHRAQTLGDNEQQDKFPVE